MGSFSKITCGVNVYPSPALVILIAFTTPFPSIVAVAVAVTPLPTLIGGWIATFGAEVYPDPPLIKVNEETFSVVKFTVAVAVATCGSVCLTIFIPFCVAVRLSIELKAVSYTHLTLPTTPYV